MYVHGQNIEKQLQLSLSTGHQKEDFNWSIAGNSNGQSPNVFSELKWRNVSGQDYSATLQWNVWQKFRIYGAYNWVNVKSGSVSDIDYAADNRTQPTYNQNFSDNKGSTSGWYVGAGYTIFNSSLFSLVPYVGYGVNKQALFIVDETGQFPDLNSDYNTQWKGPFIKVKSSLKIWRALKLAADVTYNQVKYAAQGNWNLINEFQHPVSYRHAANGYGVDAGLKLVYNITPNIGINLGYNYFNWQTGNGDDQLYLATGQVDKTQLNGVYRKGDWFRGGVDLSL
ncbi:MAG: hypothetical protein M3O71_20510 [Bacteroidota bacterium]|nr:hypothetical protein [Bacteroidota bacterium]